jgi:hypothetical protein
MKIIYFNDRLIFNQLNSLQFQKHLLLEMQDLFKIFNQKSHKFSDLWHFSMLIITGTWMRKCNQYSKKANFMIHFSVSLFSHQQWNCRILKCGCYTAQEKLMYFTVAKCT